MESLGRHTGGLFGSSLLLSVRELPTTMKSRCRNLGINLLEQSAIDRLTEYVGHWRDKGAFPPP